MKSDQDRFFGDAELYSPQSTTISRWSGSEPFLPHAYRYLYPSYFMPCTLSPCFDQCWPRSYTSLHKLHFSIHWKSISWLCSLGSMKYSRLRVLSFPTTLSRSSFPHTGHDSPAKGSAGEGHELSSEGSRSGLERCDMPSRRNRYLDAWKSSPQQMHQILLNCEAAGTNACG